LDQPQQTQSNQVVPDVKDHSFSETFKNLFLLSLFSFVMICISPYGSFFLSSWLKEGLKRGRNERKRRFLY
jgi:hypothetical protein